MPVYYNENDKKAAAWLRALMAEGLIPKGEVDERSIVDVRGADLAGFTQCHFFAGIGGWAEALRLAGWGDRPVWTGSCPCQPFSAAGRQDGTSDPRHLLPTWLRLIAAAKPPVIFSEQVAEAVKHGWLDELGSGLEQEGYTLGAGVLPGFVVGTPHKRDRLYVVAESQSQRGCRGTALEVGQRQESGRPSKDICPVPWPDGRGSGSSLTVTDVCSPSYGVPGRVGRLRAFGNAIIPQVAAEFVMAYMAEMETRS